MLTPENVPPAKSEGFAPAQTRVEAQQHQCVRSETFLARSFDEASDFGGIFDRPDMATMIGIGPSALSSVLPTERGPEGIDWIRFYQLKLDGIAEHAADRVEEVRPTTAGADPITFLHTGSGSGTIDGMPFSNSDFTITSTANTDNRQSTYGVFWIDHDTSSFAISGVGTFAVVTGARTFANNDVSTATVGYSRAGETGADLFDGPSDAAFDTWDMLSSIGPIAGTGTTQQWNTPDVLTDGGTLVFTNATVEATFQAIVPEPATWVLLCLGSLSLLPVRRRIAVNGAGGALASRCAR